VSRADAALRVVDAERRYGRVTALDGMAFSVDAGQWAALLGPNGAGKTTVMRAIAGLDTLDGGRVELFGERVSGPRPDLLGWVPQEIALYAQLTARENLDAFGRLHGMTGAVLAERVRWALDWTGLEARADDRVTTYSGGMRRRLNIACGVLHRPRVVLLDEPTVGVDPQARARIFAMLAELVRDGVALLQSTHELGDVETTCDRLVIVDHGRTVAAGRLEELVGSTVGGRARLTAVVDGTPPAALGAGVTVDGSTVTAELDDLAGELPRLLDALRAAGCTVSRLDVRRAGLAELFVHLTGRELRE
jgi:ABC-2 type transport system ATP-binding protein